MCALSEPVLSAKANSYCPFTPLIQPSKDQKQRHAVYGLQQIATGQSEKEKRDAESASLSLRIPAILSKHHAVT
jgi:hypothetical protein